MRAYPRDHHRQTSPEARVRGVRQDSCAMGPPADLSGVRRDALLRRFAESPRQQTCSGQRPSRDRVRTTWRALAVLLSRRCIRGVLRVHFKITDTTLNAELAETAEPMNLGAFCG